MKSDPGFVATNAAFVDLMMRRWERIIDFHTMLRHPYEGEEPPEATMLTAELDQIDRAQADLRDSVASHGRSFPLDQVFANYQLDAIEADILALAMMPQLDLSFRQRIARFNNNILYDFVDVDLALALLFPSRADRLQARVYFAAGSKLIAQRLLSFAEAKDSKGSGLLAQELRPPERLADYVLCRRSLDASLQTYSKLSDPQQPLADVSIPEDDRADLTSLIRHFESQHPMAAGPFPNGEGLTIAFVGAPGMGKTMISEAVAHELSRPLITVNSSRLAGAGDRAQDAIDRLFTEASVQGAVLLFDRCEPLMAKGGPHLPTMLSALERFGGLAVLTTSLPDDLDPGVERYVAWQLKLAMPDVDLRAEIWKLHMPTEVPIDESVDIDDLATRYEVNGGQVRNACALAEKRVLASEEEGAAITLDLLKAAAQAQLRADMEEYSVPSKVTLTLDDIVLPDKEKTLIQEVLDACKSRVFVMSKWGFGRRLVTGKGICCLFKGEAGTGKTLCAEILANQLDMKLYQISIPKIVSKYIGETEKNIARIFQTARANHSMLLFDEADALFTKRVAVENAIDRFSNMEVNLLLQEIERFEGITILTTNLDKNIDDAFARRIQFKIEFPFPEKEDRAAIWRLLVPPECPIGDDIDFDELGESYELSGGFIKNAVVRAAYRAASRGGVIDADDIEFAAEQECKSAGKLFRTLGTHDDW